MSMNMGQVSHIPRDILEEIYMILPVKTLMRFKSVCRSWHAFISDPQLSRLYLKQSVDQNRMRLILRKYPRTIVKRLLNRNKSSDFLSTCNGLCCVKNGDDEFILWNPSTKESRKIRDEKIEFPIDCCVGFGLGYDSRSDDYKLVKISNFFYADFPTEVKIYSRNSNCWKRIRDFPYNHPIERPGVFVSGGLHWIVSDRNIVYKYLMVVLYVEDESYGLIQMPKFGHTVVSCDIGNLGGNICLTCCYYDEYYGIWILKEYAKPESWMRIKITANVEHYFYFEPLYVFKSGEIFIRIGAEKFVAQDFEKKLCCDIKKIICLQDIEKNLCGHIKKIISRKIGEYGVFSYIESLVSPNAS